jgi:hypothetical protein
MIEVSRPDWPQHLSGHDAITARITADLAESKSTYIPVDGLYTQRPIDIMTQLAMGIDRDALRPELEQLQRDATIAVESGEVVLPSMPGVSRTQLLGEFAAQLLKVSVEPAIRDALVIFGDAQRGEMQADMAAQQAEADIAFAHHEALQQKDVVINRMLELIKRTFGDGAVAAFEKIRDAEPGTMPDYVLEDQRFSTGEVEVFFDQMAAEEKVSAES